MDFIFFIALLFGLGILNMLAGLLQMAVMTALYPLTKVLSFLHEKTAYALTGFIGGLFLGFVVAQGIFWLINVTGFNDTMKYIIVGVYSPFILYGFLRVLFKNPKGLFVSSEPKEIGEAFILLSGAVGAVASLFFFFGPLAQ